AGSDHGMGHGMGTEAVRLLSLMGLLPEMGRRRVQDLSVGEQQRVAAARALLGSPELVVADEPTSALDADATHRFMRLLLEEVERTGSTLLFASHDSSLARHFPRVERLPDLNRAPARSGDG